MKINFKNLKLLFICTVFVTGCSTPMMKFNIEEKTKLPDVPSGSGIVKAKDGYYAIGDDSPYLFILDNTFSITEKAPLQSLDNFTGDRIPKPKKGDLEALEMISEKELVVFGSGSVSPQRDIFIQILLEHPIKIERYTTTEFYKNLKSLEIFSDSELNLEAVAFRDGRLFLFNRKKNLVLNFVYEEVLNYLKGTGPFPSPAITEFALPEINGIEAGFSGATALKDQPKIIFTASVENTDNAYDDGEILGSYIGVIDISNNRVSNTFQYCLVPETESHLKVESVTIEAEIAATETKVVLITDNDKGDSVILKGILSW